MNDYSLTSDCFAEHEPKMWDNLKAQFMNHLDTINGDLQAAGLEPLKKA